MAQITNEKTVLFIDGSTFAAALSSHGYRLCRDARPFARDAAHPLYYTALPEDQEYSPLRPLIDWLDYNGYAVVGKLTREFTDPETGKRQIGQHGYGNCARHAEAGTAGRSRDPVFRRR